MSDWTHRCFFLIFFSFVAHLFHTEGPDGIFSKSFGIISPIRLANNHKKTFWKERPFQLKNKKLWRWLDEPYVYHIQLTNRMYYLIRVGPVGNSLSSSCCCPLASHGAPQSQSGIKLKKKSPLQKSSLLLLVLLLLWKYHPVLLKVPLLQQRH